MRHWISCMLLAPYLLSSLTAEAKVYHSRQSALKLAFPTATKITRKHIFLSQKQRKALEHLARQPIRSRLLTTYIGYKGSKALGFAFIETLRVRTLPATFLLVLSTQGALQRVHVLAFHEPQEYLPPKRWLKQFKGKRATALQKHGTIAGIAGATLSAVAVQRCVTRVLAIYQLLLQKTAQTQRKAS